MWSIIFGVDFIHERKENVTSTTFLNDLVDLSSAGDWEIGRVNFPGAGKTIDEALLQCEGCLVLVHSAVSTNLLIHDY